MGDTVELSDTGAGGRGYLAVPEGGVGPGLLVLHDADGLDDHVVGVCDRFAAEGFVALAPQMHRGTVDETADALVSLTVERTLDDLGGVVAELVAHDAVTSARVGVTGFCAGGGLALLLTGALPRRIGACVPFDAVFPWGEPTPEWAEIEAPVQGHFAENDAAVGPDAVGELRETLEALGKDVELNVYPGVASGFFDPTRPEVHDPDAAGLAWNRTLGFLRSHLR